MTDVRWLTPAEHEAWLALAMLTVRLPATLDSQLQHDEQLGLVDYLTLAMLAETTSGSLPQAEIARRTAMPAPRLSRTVSRLADKGYLTRSADPADRRVVVATLTDEGRAKVVGAAPGHVAQVRRDVFDRLSPEQVGQLRDIALALVSDDCTLERGGSAPISRPGR